MIDAGLVNRLMDFLESPSLSDVHLDAVVAVADLLHRLLAFEVSVPFRAAVSGVGCALQVAQSRFDGPASGHLAARNALARCLAQLERGSSGSEPEDDRPS
jgi:hypothetical protein